MACFYIVCSLYCSISDTLNLSVKRKHQKRGKNGTEKNVNSERWLTLRLHSLFSSHVSADDNNKNKNNNTD